MQGIYFQSSFCLLLSSAMSFAISFVIWRPMSKNGQPSNNCWIKEMAVWYSFLEAFFIIVWWSRRVSCFRTPHILIWKPISETEVWNLQRELEFKKHWHFCSLDLSLSHHTSILCTGLSWTVPKKLLVRASSLLSLLLISVGWHVRYLGVVNLPSTLACAPMI